MAYSFTIPAVAALSVLGAGVGVGLGRSAIADINPVYFSAQPAQSFFADLAPGGYRPAVQTGNDPVDMWASAADVSGRPLCVHCSSNLVDPLYASSPPPAVEADQQVEIEPITVQPVAPQDLDRYASFPVTQDEAQLQQRPAANGYASRAEDVPPSAPESGEPDGL